MIEALFLIIVFVFVIGLAYFITKKIANLGTQYVQGKNMKILETMQVGMGQYVHLVQVGEQMFTMSVSKEGVRYLCEVSHASIDLTAYNTSNKPPSFEQYLKKWTQKRNDNR